MPRDYQRKKSPYLLPRDVYMQVKWILSGYDRLKRERADILWGSPSLDGMPKGSRVSTPTEDKAVKLAYLQERMEAVEQSAVEIRGEYSHRTSEDFDPVKAFWSYDYFNVSFIRKHPDDMGPSERTWKRYKDYFASKVAKRAKIF